MQQRTLQRAVSVDGIGLHTGEPVRLELHPAPVDSGVVLRRVDLDPVVSIPALAEHVSDTQRCTCLGSAASGVATVEHLLAALAGLGVDNVRVDISGPEVPVMDGSALPFVRLVESVGLVLQDAPRRFMRILREVTVEEGDKRASFLPFDGFSVSFTIDYDLPELAPNACSASFDVADDDFASAVSAARTFGFMHEVEQLRASGLVRGGSLDNAVVIDDGRVLNPGGLRYPDELVRHKILDAIGDISLLGAPLIGRYCAYKSGHGLNSLAVRALLSERDAWEWVTFEGAASGIAGTATAAR